MVSTFAEGVESLTQWLTENEKLHTERQQLWNECRQRIRHLREENAQILDLLAELQAEDSEQSDFDADDDYADGMIASGSGGDGGDDDDLEETFSFDGLLPPDETPRGPAKAERRRPEWKIQDKTTQLVGEQLPVHDRLPKIKVPASASSKNGSRVGSAAISPINVTSQTIMGFESSLALPPILTPALTHQQPAVVLPMDLVSAEGDLIKLVKLGQLFPNVRYNDIVGYQALRVYLSLVPAGAAAANQFATFTCWTQVEQQPLQQPQLIFHIMSMDGSNVTVSGLDPNAAYARLAEQYALRGIALPERGGCRKMHSGEEFFGFTHPTVMRLFQQQQQ